MHVISQKALRAFWSQHPTAEGALRAWIKTVEQAAWQTFADVRASYSTGDQFERFTVFNIGGNKFRLIAVIHFNRQKVYVRHILTHKQYSKGKWKED